MRHPHLLLACLRLRPDAAQVSCLVLWGLTQALSGPWPPGREANRYLKGWKTWQRLREQPYQQEWKVPDTVLCNSPWELGK